MKKEIANLRVRLTGLLCLSTLCLASCSQNDDSMPDQPLTGERHEIVLTGSMGDIGSEVVPSTRGDVNPGAAMTVYFGRRDRNADGTWPRYREAPYATALSATRAAGTGNQAITFTTAQYYPMEKLSGEESSNSYNQTQFVGWYPAAFSFFDNNKVKFALDGKKDILLSNEVTGSYTSQFTATQNTLTFTHLMTKIMVKVKAADTSAPNLWGKVTDIQVRAQPSELTVTLPAESLAWGVYTNFSLEGFATKTLTDSYVACGQLFIRPVITGMGLKLTVTTEKGGDRDVTIIGTDSETLLESGKAYTISLDFKSTDITPTATISAWTAGANPPALDL